MAFDYVSDDVIPSLEASQRPYPLDLAAYRDVVLDRFSNPHLRDTNQRVAADGFAKIPGFLWPTFRECLARGASIAKTAKLPALFFEFLGRWHRGELPFEYQDQGMDAARRARDLRRAPIRWPRSFRDPILWGPLAGDAHLVAALVAAHAEVLQFLKEHGRG